MLVASGHEKSQITVESPKAISILTGAMNICVNSSTNFRGRNAEVLEVTMLKGPSRFWADEDGSIKTSAGK